MAVNKGKNTPIDTPEQAGVQVDTPAQQRDYSEHNTPRGAGIAQLGRIGRATRRSDMSEVLALYMEALNEKIKGFSSEMGFQIIPLAGQHHNLHYSACVVVADTTIAGGRTACAYTLILEGSATQPKPEYVNMHNRQVEVLRTPMDAWDELTWSKVQDVVIDKFGDVNVLNAGSTVVPEKADPKDGERMHQILWGAQEAIYGALEIAYPDFTTHFNIGEFFDRRSDRIVAQFAYNANDGESITGAPVRSDITLKISATDRNTQNQNMYSAFQHQSTKDLVEVNSYVDLVYAPQNALPAPGQPIPTEVMQPRLVITKINPIDAPYTPEIFLLGLATSQLLGENYAWASQYSNFAQEEVHDIGGMGYRMKNPSDPTAAPVAIDTKTNTFGKDQMFDLIRTACYRYPLYSIDCEDAGPDSWLTGALVEAAHGNRASAQAMIDAADRLTNGLFSKYWQGGDIAVSESNRIHLGTYVDATGQLRDLREIDNLAILNLFGANDINTCNLWENTFNDVNTPIEIRQEDRLNIVKQVTTNQLKITGSAERVTFTPVFLDALVDACMEAGLLVDEDGLQPLFGTNFQVGNTFVTSLATGGHGVSGMVSRQGHGGPVAFHRPFNRW